MFEKETPGPGLPMQQFPNLRQISHRRMSLGSSLRHQANWVLQASRAFEKWNPLTGGIVGESFLIGPFHSNADVFSVRETGLGGVYFT